MPRRVLDWIWLPVGLAAGLVAARLAFAPRILEREPAPGASVPATAEIRITFDQAMEKASVVERLDVEAPVSTETRWEGTTLILRPETGWPSDSTIEVGLRSGARSARGLSMILGTRWSFQVAAPRLAYLWPADGPAQIYARSLDQAEAARLTDAPDGVQEFSVGARGTRLAYVASEQLRDLDLVTGRDRLWFSCPDGERCMSPVLSPDGNHLAFVRAASQGEGIQQGPGRVWMIVEGEDEPVPVSPQGEACLAPFWSPQGWLAFVDTSRMAILLVDVAAGEPFDPVAVVPSMLGERGIWSPDGQRLVYPDLVFSPPAAAPKESIAGVETHLIAWEVARGVLTDLTAVGGWQAEDASPAFSPDGEWVYFSRRLLAPGRWTSGKQLWRMRWDGSRAEPLTDEPFINHGGPTVGPHGSILAYLRYDLGTPLEPAEVRWLDLRTRTEVAVVQGGYSPAWIP